MAEDRISETANTAPVLNPEQTCPDSRCFDQAFLDAAATMKMPPEALETLLEDTNHLQSILDSALGLHDPRFLQAAGELEIAPEDLAHFVERACEVQRAIEDRQELERELRSVPYQEQTRLRFEHILPWTDSIPAADLIPLLTAAIRKHVAMDEDAALTAALWAMHTHALDAFSITPALVIRSGAGRTGKTTMLSVLSHLVARPLDLCAGAPAAITASLGYRPTLLIDDGAPLLAGNRDLRALARTGRQRAGANLLRNERLDTLKISLFAATAITIEGVLPRCLAGRSIEVLLERRKPEDTVTRLHAAAVGELQRLARMITRWADDSTKRLGLMNTVAESCDDENWMALLLIATDAGQQWEMRARAAMQRIRAQSSPSTIELLLSAIRGILEFRENAPVPLLVPGGRFILDRDRIRSVDLARLLCDIEGQPWQEWGKLGQPITPNALARLLAETGIQPATMKFHTADQTGRTPDLTERGYLHAQFTGAFQRYLPQDTRHVQGDRF